MFTKTLRDIIAGYGNSFKLQIGMLRPEIQKAATAKLEICHSCPIRDGKRCSSNRSGKAIKTFIYKEKETRKKGEVYSGCGCPIHEKSLSLKSQCPLGKF